MDNWTSTMEFEKFYSRQYTLVCYHMVKKGMDTYFQEKKIPENK